MMMMMMMDVNLKKFIEFLYEQKRKKFSTIFCTEKININEYPVRSICIGCRLSIIQMKNLSFLNITRSVIAIDCHEHIVNVYKLANVRSVMMEKINIDFQMYLQYILKCIDEISKCISDYGIKLSLLPLETIGYKLFKPKLLPDNNYDDDHNNHKPFYLIPPKSLSWALFILDENYNSFKMEKFKQFFSKRSKFYGINLKECFISTFVQVKNVSEIDAIFSNLKTFQIDFVIFGISHGSKLGDVEIYELIKYYGNTIYGIANQVFRTDNHSDNNQYMDSLVMKTCLRIGGQPNIVHPHHWNRFPLNTNTTMIVGINEFAQHFHQIKLIFHSLIGTVDDIFTSYISINKISLDYNDNIYEQMFEDLLDKYYEKNNYHPRTVIIFQNFPIGDFKKVLTTKSLADVRLTIIYVNKFTSTYFLPPIIDDNDNNNNGISVNMNFLYPETDDNELKEFIINIVPPTFEYNNQWQNQHCCCWKPCHYTIFFDDCNFTIEQLQEFCFTMCHYYYNNFYTSFLPVPMEYALKFARDACSRFAALIVDQKFSFTKSIDELIEYFHQNVKIHDNLEYSIF
uniref:Uncharacterized protein LOC113796887 n=1 Tax=Dermatophagoides pteronyssinus TaxID=6956 RepID=A0A6P6YCA7_DERPT|nr:uncharacterized protein LOC113796887 [Dermatophagoides pteronyssinus]